MWKSAALLGLILLGTACTGQPSAPPSEEAPGPTPSVARIPIGELPEIDVDAVMVERGVHEPTRFAEMYAPGFGNGKGVGSLS